MKIIICLLIGLMTSCHLYACGTVESRSKFYFEKQDMHQKLRELIYLNCEGVMQNYNNKPVEDSLLVEVISDALIQSDRLLFQMPDIAWKFRNTAIALFFRFGQLNTMEDKPIHNELLLKLSDTLQVTPEVLYHKRTYVDMKDRFGFPFTPSGFPVKAYAAIKSCFPEFK